MDNARAAINRFITQRNDFSTSSSQFAMQKRFRACADSYKEWYKFEISSLCYAQQPHLADLLIGPSCRYYALHGYTSMFRIDDLPPGDADLKFLEEVMKDETALACERTHAASSLGLLLWLKSKREESLKIQRKGLKFVIGESARAVRLRWFPEAALGGSSNSTETTNGERFDLNQKELKEAVERMIQSNPVRTTTLDTVDPQRIQEARAQIIRRMMETGGFPSEQAVLDMMDAMGVDLTADISRYAAAHGGLASSSSGNGTSKRTDLAQVTHQLLLGPFAPPGIREFTSDYISKSMRITGACCDLCSNPVPASATSKLFAHCETCKRVAYCSRECQVADWQRHKKSCRPPSEYKVGDLVRIQGLKTRPEINAMLLEVKGPSESPGRFICSFVGSEPGKGMSLKPENMHIIVPLEERMELKEA